MMKNSKHDFHFYMKKTSFNVFFNKFIESLKCVSQASTNPFDFSKTGDSLLTCIILLLLAVSISHPRIIRFLPVSTHTFACNLKHIVLANMKDNFNLFFTFYFRRNTLRLVPASLFIPSSVT